MCYTIKDNKINISIRVIPNSSKNELVFNNGQLRLKITVPPVENKANKFVIEYFSKLFKIPKTSISIIKGHTSKDKVISMNIDNSSVERVQQILVRLCV